ncbi:MAG: hypothetical protein FD125_3044 [bacterium]|nr:MAG: hypothetical protein FD125_3044 [bacterium]
MDFLVDEQFILELPGEAAASLNDRETRGLVVSVRKLGEQPWSPVQVREVGPFKGKVEVAADFDVRPALYRLWRMMPPRPAADDDPNIIRMPIKKEA